MMADTKGNILSPEAEDQPTGIPPEATEAKPTTHRLSKLEEGGQALSNHFMQSQILRPQQKIALTKIAEWFKDDTTKDYTAVVSMPTGSGKTGIICCLPYYLGGAGIADIDFNKPILVIAQSCCILDQLEKELLEDPFLFSIGLVNDNRYRYTVYPMTMTEKVKKLKAARSYDIVKKLKVASSSDIALTNAQNGVEIKGYH